MSVTPFQFLPELTAIAIAYRNQALVADLVLPRVTPVSKQVFSYLLWAMAEGFTIPDTKVGRTSEPNQVEFTAQLLQASTVDYGLDDFIPNADLENAPSNVDLRAKAVEGLSDLIALDREVRVASLVFALNTYPAANRTTLSGTSQFSDFTNSDPLATIMTALDTPVVRPNVMVIGRPAFSVLARHPKIVGAALGNSGTSGVAKREDIARIFELEEVVVGEGFLNSAKRGQAVSMSRVWGKHISLISRNRLADAQRGTTFGMTVPWGDRVAGTIDEPKRGLRGGITVRTGESVKELITCPDLGYFIQNAVG
ncbi:hypothetical protein JCM15519_38710 [Fundidesulfovibrio butyratiphilus]